MRDKRKEKKRDLFESKPGSKEVPAIELMDSIVSIAAITKLLFHTRKLKKGNQSVRQKKQEKRKKKKRRKEKKKKKREKNKIKKNNKKNKNGKERRRRRRRRRRNQ